MKYATAIGISLATLAIALGYGAGERWAGAALAVAVGLLWLVGWLRDWSWIASPGLACFVGLAALGIWWELTPAGMLAGVVAGLAAWDLVHFAQRLRGAGRVMGAAELVRSHMLRLLPIVLAGLLLGAVGLGVQIELRFGWALLLGALAVLGLRWAMRSSY